MCGVAGLWRQAPADPYQLAADVAAMTDTLVHRGPDGRGVWTDSASGIALGHRRLAVIDTSANGDQPMLSPSARYVLVLNGEIYNHRALRREVEAADPGLRWRGHSDTEALLAAIDRWGLEPTLARARGMFALALWDRAERVLVLARDRLGEKPLYYGLVDGDLVFASELKALRAHPAWRGEIDREALADFLRSASVPAPRSIQRGVAKLPPGCVVVIGASALGRRELPSPRPYWSLAGALADGAAAPVERDERAALAALESTLRDAVAEQMVADVPVGAFLSGGIDSSLVVALMQARTSRPVRTYSIGFPDARHDEAPDAARIAAHLGTEHAELYVSPDDVRRFVPELPAIFDEPFADPAQIPTLALARLARRDVTVALSGDGGDELFAGYGRHAWAARYERGLDWLPGSTRRGLARAIEAPGARGWDAALGAIRPLLPAALREPLAGDRVLKGAAIVGAPCEETLYSQLADPWPDSHGLLLGANVAAARGAAPAVPGASLLERLLFRDQSRYLPDYILTKVDRIAMSASLETRIPLLDHRVVELSWRLPVAMKMRGAAGKWALREILFRHVPRELVDRPKTPFAPPLAGWLRGPLREWAAALLDPARLQREGWLDAARVAQCWSEHVEGRRNWSLRLWSVLMFQGWLEAGMSAAGASRPHASSGSAPVPPLDQPPIARSA